jgi:zinc protease
MVGLCKNQKGYQSVAMSQEDKQLAAKVLVTENERAKKFGFTEGELNRAKSEFLASTEKAITTEIKRTPLILLESFNFLEKEPVPGIEWTYETLKQIIPLITVADVNGLIKEYVKEDNRVIILTGPEKAGLKKVTEQEVFDALKVNSEN